MNYIRTKTGHIYKHKLGFDRYDYSTGDVYYRVENKKGFYNEFSREKDIVNYADTIAELCDEFIIKVKDTENEEYGYLIIDKLGGYEKVLSLNKQAQENGAIIYGAIWTDKGLIFVARMNSKGELELL